MYNLKVSKMLDRSIQHTTIGGIIFLMMVLFMGCKKSDQQDLLPQEGVDVDVIEFFYARSEQEFSIKGKGAWSASLSDESWISLSETEGTLTAGATKNITVSASRNSGLSREATIVIAIEGQPDFELLIIQEEGFIQLKDASIEGVLKVRQVIDDNNVILIPYTRGLVNDKLLVSVTASGEGANGIMPISDLELTVEREEGTLSIPLNGEPTDKGEVELTVSISNANDYTSLVAARVLGEYEVPVGAVYYDQKLNMMQWGGDYINKKSGIKGGFIGKAEKDVDGKDATIYYLDEDIPVVEVDYLTVGSPNFFHMSSAYRASRGAPSPRGLGGSGMYERPGYLQVGDGQKKHTLMTQMIWTIPAGEAKKVKVSVDLARWENASKKVSVLITNDGEASVGQLEVENEFEWKTYEFFITGATSRTRIRFETDDEEDPNGLYGRFFIRNILVQEVLE